MKMRIHGLVEGGWNDMLLREGGGQSYLIPTRVAAAQLVILVHPACLCLATRVKSAGEWN